MGPYWFSFCHVFKTYPTLEGPFGVTWRQAGAYTRYQGCSGVAGAGAVVPPAGGGGSLGPPEGGSLGPPQRGVKEGEDAEEA